MNLRFFEDELRKIVQQGVPIINPKYVGGACYGKLDENLVAKISFTVNSLYAPICEEIKITILNRTEGEVDSTLIGFDTVLGKKPAPTSDEHQDDVAPFISIVQGKAEWSFHPTQQDYQQMSNAVRDYCEVFQSQEMGGQGMQISQQM